MSLPILAIFCTSFCISCQIQQLQHLSIAAAPFPNQDWGTIPAEHNEEENQRPQLRWDSLLAPAHQHEPSKKRGSRVNASSAHIESESSAHIANESSAHRETASSAHKERSSAHIDAGNQPFRVWLGGVGGPKRSHVHLRRNF